LHCATFLPLADHTSTIAAARAADDAMRRALGRSAPDAVRIEGDDFAGWLRRPAEVARPRVVLVVSGLNSGKEEFGYVDDELRRRGVATFSFDGPGQGVLVDRPPRADFHRVASRVVDALDARTDLDTAAGVGLIGLSLGGHYAALTAAHDPRIAAAALISGPYRLDAADLPPFVTETLTVRGHGPDAAHAFARRVDLAPVAARITAPLRVVEGGQDVTPGVTPAAAIVADVPHAEIVVVPHGDHLVCNARADWLPDTADWLVEHVVSGRG
jgi:pimeloyl-ACP methyl ester carboxylesterase